MTSLLPRKPVRVGWLPLVPSWRIRQRRHLGFQGCRRPWNPRASQGPICAFRIDFCVGGSPDAHSTRHQPRSFCVQDDVRTKMFLSSNHLNFARHFRSPRRPRYCEKWTIRRFPPNYKIFQIFLRTSDPYLNYGRFFLPGLNFFLRHHKKRFIIYLLTYGVTFYYFLLADL